MKLGLAGYSLNEWLVVRVLDILTLLTAIGIAHYLGWVG